MSGRSGRGPSQRQLRIGEEIRHVIVSILDRGELRDPDVAGHPVTVTEVRMGNDLKTATVFVVALGGVGTDQVVKGLNRAAPAIRHQIAGHVHLKYLPSLTFRRDKSFDEAQRIEDLLRDPSVARDLDHSSDEDE